MTPSTPQHMTYTTKRQTKDNPLHDSTLFDLRAHMTVIGAVLGGAHIENGVRNRVCYVLTYETLSGDEIEDLINKNIYPANKEDLKVEEDDKGSSLGSMGLKPKIVH